jgi:1,4-dihydroxy-2-naphthoate octaprenyltransferase
MAITYYETKTFDLLLGLMTLIAGVSIHAGTNLANDYFDQSTDDVNIYFSQFNGGSRMIQNGIIPSRTILRTSILFYILGSLMALLILFITNGLLLLIFLIIAVSLGFFYTAVPISLSYHGLGEFAVFVGFGPLGVFSSYYIQVGHINSPLLVIGSVPIALLISMVLFINEFQDVEADAEAGKRTLVVSLGKRRSVKIYAVGMILSYLSVAIAILLSLLPITMILPLLTAPIAIKAIMHVNKNFDKIKELLPANGQTILVHFVFGLLMSFSFLIS